MQQIVTLPQPVIAAVQATATAAGCQLVASCDLAVASQHGEIRDARRQYRPVLLDADGRVVAQRPAQAAMEMLLTGEMISAEDAARIGLINRVVAPGSERDEALNSPKRSPPNRR